MQDFFHQQYEMYGNNHDSGAEDKSATGKLKGLASRVMTCILRGGDVYPKNPWIYGIFTYIYHKKESYKCVL